jgi:hypothetical protein
MVQLPCFSLSGWADAVALFFSLLWRLWGGVLVVSRAGDWSRAALCCFYPCWGFLSGWLGSSVGWQRLIYLRISGGGSNQAFLDFYGQKPEKPLRSSLQTRSLL